jgi:gluconate kinase
MNLETEINFDNIHKRIEENIHLLKKEQIKNYIFISFLIANYVDYPRKECKNVYNEMFIYLTKNIILERIKSRYQILYDNTILSTEKANNHLLENPFIPKETKLIEQRKKEKRNHFRKFSKKYRIKDNRLIYLYKYKGKEIEKKIPFSNELNNILFDCHCTETHNGVEESKKILLTSEYYFEGIAGFLKKFIEKCPVYQIKYNSKHVNIPEKPILNEGPQLNTK